MVVKLNGFTCDMLNAKLYRNVKICTEILTLEATSFHSRNSHPKGIFSILIFKTLITTSWCVSCKPLLIISSIFTTTLALLYASHQLSLTFLDYFLKSFFLIFSWICSLCKLDFGSDVNKNSGIVYAHLKDASFVKFSLEELFA